MDIINNASKPILVVGGGVRWSKAGDLIDEISKKLKIPVATSLNGKDVINSTNPLNVGVVGTYSRGSANKSVLAADLAIFVGTDLGGMVTNFWTIPKIGIKAIHIDIDPEVLGRNYPLEVGIMADAKMALTEMIKFADETMVEKRISWVEEVQGYCRDWYDEFRPLLQSDNIPIRPERVCHDLSLNLPDNSFVVVDTGHGGMWMGGMFDLKSSGQSYIRSAGHLGWAFPASLGVKCAAPDRPVICFTGDAGFWYHIAEVETAVRWGINAVIVVNNNGAGNQSKRGFDRVYGGTQTDKAREMWTFNNVNFAQIAKHMGAESIRVENPKDFTPALQKAIALNKCVILDVVTDVDALAPLAYTE